MGCLFPHLSVLPDHLFLTPATAPGRQPSSTATVLSGLWQWLPPGLLGLAIVMESQSAGSGYLFLVSDNSNLKI